MSTTPPLKASELLADPANWTKGSTNYGADDQFPCCMMAAVSRAAGCCKPGLPWSELVAAYEVFEVARERLKAHLGVASPFDWNDADERTHPEVIAALKACDL